MVWEWTRNELGILEWWNSPKFPCVIPSSFPVHSHSIPNIPSSTRNGAGIFLRNPPGIPGSFLVIPFSLLVRKVNAIKGDWTIDLTKDYVTHFRQYNDWAIWPYNISKLNSVSSKLITWLWKCIKQTAITPPQRAAASGYSQHGPRRRNRRLGPM